MVFNYNSKNFRRGKSESGDIDVLITHPSDKSTNHDKKHKTNLLKKVVESLKKCKLITESISLGDTKFMVNYGPSVLKQKYFRLFKNIILQGACKWKPDTPTRRIDIRFVPHDQYYCSILYFTGSDIFNQKMRLHAHENQFTLNEYHLRPIGSTGK